MHVRGGCVDAATRADFEALEVVRVLDELARALDHALGGVRVFHERAQFGAVVIDVRDVRAREACYIAVDLHRVGLAPRDVPVRLRLPHEPHRVGVLEHRAHAVRDADGHVPGGLVVLADGHQGFQGAVGERGVAAGAVHNERRVRARVRGLSEQPGVSTEGLERRRLRGEVGAGHAIRGGDYTGQGVRVRGVHGVRGEQGEHDLRGEEG
mmetsp:Transcript_9192/g.34317  ORF Transcript_9192/g.34317 Transcript_9192/m.34317 type:complete len:210 (+) Transcript_9192:2180-2809(+)